MNRYDRRLRRLAICLSALAGYVDALGFLALGGFFVSFMSGNSTRLAVGLARGSGDALIAAALVCGFVAGVVCGSFAGRRLGSRRRVGVLMLVGAFLTVAAGLNAAGWPHGALAMMLFAMGAENAVFEAEGEVTIGLTYMTGTLVKLGQRITTALTGGDKLSWLPYLFLWLGLIGGAVVGASVYPTLGLNGLWIAAAAAFFMAFVAQLLGGRDLAGKAVTS